MGLFRETMATILESYFRGLNLTDDVFFEKSSGRYNHSCILNIMPLILKIFIIPILQAPLTLNHDHVPSLSSVFQKSSGQSRASHHNMAQK